MQKIMVSVVVIGFGEENHKMYPHLYDFLKNLRDAFDDVVYINFANDKGVGQDVDLAAIYSAKARIIEMFNFNSLNFRDFKSLWVKIRAFLSIYYLLHSYCENKLSFYKRRNRLIKNLRCAKLKYKESLVLAIDQSATYLAKKYFPGKVIYWSMDIWAKDCLWSNKKTITWKSQHNPQDKIVSFNISGVSAMIIQDRYRKKLLEDLLGYSFPDTIYLPVSLNDSEFCRKVASARCKKEFFSTVNIIQIGWIVENRWSDELIDAYLNWPGHYKLHLHGKTNESINNKTCEVHRKPDVCSTYYDSDGLSEFLNAYDIGFVGYKEGNANHYYIENASAQLVEYLRLGIPVIGCGSPLFNDFIDRQKIGISISSPEGMEIAIKNILNNYSLFSCNARELYERRYNLTTIFNDYLIKSLEAVVKNN